MQLFTILNTLTKFLSDPDMQALFAKFIAWFQSLSPAEQMAEATLYEPGHSGLGNYGCPHNPDCDGGPDCPEELLPVRDAIIAAVRG